VEKNPPQFDPALLDSMNGKQVVLVTGHRRESFGDGFENLCRAIRDLADQHEDAQFVYPMHLNPNVREPVNRILAGHERISLIEPLSYEPFVWLMNRSTIVLTDSGGVQEEAPSLGKPVLVMRETTERPEGVDAGNAYLVGTNYDKIVQHVSLLLRDSSERNKMAAVNNPYGDGTASKQIADAIIQHFKSA
jgi:UDP-N-acetylglucosamine 2-epimerase (non-hydrolysing)